MGYAFVEETLPLLKQKGINLDVYYVASAELFDLLPDAEKERIFPAKLGEKALWASRVSRFPPCTAGFGLKGAAG